MTDQALPDFESTSLPAEPTPRKSRPRPQRKRPAKKKARAAPTPKSAKRVPKKRRVRKIGKSPLLAALYVSDKVDVVLTPGHREDLWTVLLLFKKYTPAMRKHLLEELSKVLT